MAIAKIRTPSAQFPDLGNGYIFYDTQIAKAGGAAAGVAVSEGVVTHIIHATNKDETTTPAVSPKDLVDTPALDGASNEMDTFLTGHGELMLRPLSAQRILVADLAFAMPLQRSLRRQEDRASNEWERHLAETASATIEQQEESLNRDYRTVRTLAESLPPSLSVALNEYMQSSKRTP